MLNNYKIIKIEKKKKIISFWNAPFPSIQRVQLQLNSKDDLLSGLPIVFRQPTKIKKRSLKKRPRISKFLKADFFFSTSPFNTIFLLKKFLKNKTKKFGIFNLKKKLSLINSLFIKKNYFKGYSIGKNKGGYFVSVLGFRSFMPKSHSLCLLTKPPLDCLIGLKINHKRKRFSNWKNKNKVGIALISSSKPRKKKSFFFKKGQRLRVYGYYWRGIAAIVNKRMEKEESVS